MREAFVWASIAVSATMVEDLFAVQWSPRGSNRHQLELATQTFFRDFLQDAEGNSENVLVCICYYEIHALVK